MGLGLLLGALGVVYGDIGTSPLYALKTVFTLDRNLVPDEPDVFGVISLVFWSITLIVSIKYVIFILRADNEGEGGVMALAALAPRALLMDSGRRAGAVLALGALGAALFYGDSVITPAISVLSAVEGLEVISPQLAVVVLPVSAVVLILLFAVQRWGTGRVGAVFGPTMVLWFVCIGVAGAAEVARHLHAGEGGQAVSFASGSSQRSDGDAGAGSSGVRVGARWHDARHDQPDRSCGGGP